MTGATTVASAMVSMTPSSTELALLRLQSVYSLAMVR